MSGQQATLTGDMTAGTGKYNTRLKYVKPIADILGGFDLDPCASADSALADENIRETGGLKADWNQYDTVWCNHPYARGEPEQWLAKAAATDASTTVVTLSKGDPSTDWFHEYYPQADLICFPDRIKFVGESSSADFANVYGVFGPYPDELEEFFETKGWVVPRPHTVDWSLASVSRNDVLELSLGTDALGAPSGIDDAPTVSPVTAKIRDDTLEVLTIEEPTETWYLLRQNTADVGNGQIQCAVDTGSGWEHVILHDVSQVESSTAPDGVVSLKQPASAPLDSVGRFLPAPQRADA
jgi:hypothetical protein